MTSPTEGRTQSGLFSFRVATPADAELLPLVTRECYLPWYSHLWEPGEMDAYLAFLYAPARVASELADPNVVYEFAYRTDAPERGPVAFLKLELRNDRAGIANAAYLERVYVAADAGRGCGTALMLRAFDRAREAGRERIWLRAMDSSDKPVSRYAALGFREFARERYSGQFRMREHLAGMVVLVRELEPGPGG
jgi:GNAT superfamily N-acetyltransferase